MSDTAVAALIGALIFWWVLRPVSVYAAIDSDRPCSTPPRSAVLLSQITLVGTGTAALVAWRAKSPYAATLLMVYLGALLAASYSDPAHIAREPGESVPSFIRRFVKERAQRILRGKLVAALTALGTPFVAPESWHLPALAAAMVVSTGKSSRCIAVERSLRPPEAWNAVRQKWMDISMNALGRTLFMAAGPATAIYSLDQRPLVWSALAGYSLLAGAVAFIALLIATRQ